MELLQIVRHMLLQDDALGDIGLEEKLSIRVRHACIDKSSLRVVQTKGRTRQRSVRERAGLEQFQGITLGGDIDIRLWYNCYD